MSLTVISIYSIRQLNFMLTTDPGYQTENILKVTSIKAPSGGDMGMWNKYNQITTQLARNLKNNPSLIKQYSFCPTPISRPWQNNWGHIPGGERKKIGNKMSNESYFSMLGIEATEGRLWNDSIDNELDFSIIINESAKKELGISDIDKTPVIMDHLLLYSSLMEGKPTPRYRIIGVINDFSTRHLSKGYEPIIFFNYKGSPQSGLMISIQPDKKQEAINYIQKLYHESCGDEFRYSFLKDEVLSVYNEDKQLARIASFFAAIAILISSMGLFSLSLFDIQQRFHEIAIRKINGATSGTIKQMLFFKYSILYGISCLIALPLSWLVITLYMEDFVYKVSIAWWIFAIAILLTGGISFLTLIWQIRKAARTNPSDIIRSE